MKFRAIAIDPPVPFETWGKRPSGIDSRAAAAFYDLMTWDDLAALGPLLQAVAEPDSAVFLWVCAPLLVETLTMAQAWGWSYKTKAFTWVKLRGPATFHVGMGYWTRANTEDVWLLTRGDPQRISRDVAQIVADGVSDDAALAPLGRHSQKPETVQDRIERLVGGPYLEVFARRRRPGWTCVGNELDGLDVREALARLAADTPLPVVTPPVESPMMDLEGS